MIPTGSTRTGFSRESKAYWPRFVRSPRPCVLGGAGIGRARRREADRGGRKETQGDRTVRLAARAQGQTLRRGEEGAAEEAALRAAQARGSTAARGRGTSFS